MIISQISTDINFFSLIGVNAENCFYLLPLIDKANDHILRLAFTASVTMKSNIAEITGFGISAICDLDSRMCPIQIHNTSLNTYELFHTIL